MKHLFCAVTFVSFTWCNFATALPISAFSGLDVKNSFVIGGGGSLPPLLDSRFTGSFFADFGQSVLNAPDAVPFEGSQTINAGFDSVNPSIFSRTSSATRNLGTEGAVSGSNHQMYRMGGIDISERGVTGEASAQASLSSEFYETSTSSEVRNTHFFSFTNQDQSAFTYGMQGIFEMNMFSTANGANAFSENYATLDMFFESSNILDIQFADIEPFNLNETSSGANSMVSIVRETDVAGTGHLSMTGYSSAGDGDAFGSSRMGYALGITLQPGETITMAHRIRYSTLAEISLPVEVSSPTTFALLLLGLFGLFATWRRSMD